MKKKKKIYICGPISGDDIEERRAAFAEVESMLEAEGLEVANPRRLAFTEARTRKECLRLFIALLVSCDYIYLMNGWTGSFLASLEYLVATSTGIEIYANEEFLSDTNAEQVAFMEGTMEMELKFTPGTHLERVRDYISRKGGNAQ